MDKRLWQVLRRQRLVCTQRLRHCECSLVQYVFAACQLPAFLTVSIVWHDERTDEDMRSSANLAYAYPAKGELTILIAHKVEKVLFNGKMQATGVSFGSSKSKMFTVKAKKEVILTAGALASAPILQRSGVCRLTYCCHTILRPR